MDADDIAYPDRFEQVTRFLEKRPDVDVLGTGVCCFSNSEDTVNWMPPWHEHREIRVQLLFRNCISHPTAVLRRERFQDGCHEYAPGFIHAEDYELWERVSGTLHLANLPSITVKRRMHSESVTSVHREKMRCAVQRIHERALLQMKYQLTLEHLTVHEAIVNLGNQLSQPVSVSTAVQWLSTIMHRNSITRLYDDAALCKVLSAELHSLVNWPIGHTISGVRDILWSPLRNGNQWKFKDYVRLVAKSIVRRPHR